MRPPMHDDFWTRYTKFIIACMVLAFLLGGAISGTISLLPEPRFTPDLRR